MASKKKLLIIAGHGEGDPGACSIWGHEEDYTRELATLLQKSLKGKLAVTMYDQDKNCYTQSKKGNVPDYAAYDATLEVHFNAKAKKDPYGDGSFTGIGGYVHPSNAKGRKMADAIMAAVTGIGFKLWGIFNSTGLLNLNNAQRAGAAYFLIETAFIDDGDDMKWYTANKSKVAQAIAQGILKGLGLTSKAEEPEPDQYYRIRKSWEDAASQTFAGTKENAVKACPAGYSVYDPDGKCIYMKESVGMQASAFAGCTEEEYVEAVGKLYTENEKKTGILASVPLAQSILESGYGQTDLAQVGNNMHGMKCSLSGNTWKGTTWNGDSFYEKDSPEVYNGKTVMKRSQFRCYECIEDSIADHSAYLLNAANGSKQRYAGLQGEKDYKKAIRIIKDGGYATDPEYVSKIENIIERWELTRFNADADTGTDNKKPENDNKNAENGTSGKKDVPFLINTTCNVLNIRSGAGLSHAVVGCISEREGQKKNYTIVEVKGEWGRLLSGAGWIHLGYTKRV